MVTKSTTHAHLIYARQRIAYQFLLEIFLEGVSLRLSIDQILLCIFQLPLRLVDAGDDELDSERVYARLHLEDEKHIVAIAREIASQGVGPMGCGVWSVCVRGVGGV